MSFFLIVKQRRIDTSAVAAKEATCTVRTNHSVACTADPQEKLVIEFATQAGQHSLRAGTAAAEIRSATRAFTTVRPTYAAVTLEFAL